MLTPFSFCHLKLSKLKQLSTRLESSSVERFFASDFFANTTGTLKYLAARQAIPIPEASMVSIFVILYFYSYSSSAFANGVEVDYNVC